MPDSKWQNEYDERQRQVECGDAHTEASRSERSNSVAESELTEEEVVSMYATTLKQTPDLSKQYHQALLAMVPARFLPYKVKVPTVPNGFIKIRTPCALWVTSACERAQNDTGPLKDALMSIVLMMVSTEDDRPDLAMTSNTFYTRSLTKTRRALQPIIDQNVVPQGTDVVGVFLACHAASVFELMANSSLEHMKNHVLGIGNLIAHLQTHPSMVGINAVIGDSLIEEYRMLQMNFTLMHRTPSQLKKVSIGNQKNDVGSSIFTDLLDLADEIIPEMVRIDTLRVKFMSNPWHCIEVLNASIPRLLQIHQQFQVWNDILKDKLIENELDDFEPGSVNKPGALVSYEFASTWMFSTCYDCYAIETAIEAFEFLESVERGAAVSSQLEKLRSDLLTEAAGIVDIIPFFLQKDKGIIGRSIAIWPLEGAWSALANENGRLKKDEEKMERSGEVEGRREVQERRERVRRGLQMCRDIVVVARRFGLPVFKER
jgi:hypothetical protein